MRYSILALLAAALAFAPGANAAAVKTKPIYSVTAAAKSGKNVKFTIAVTVANVPKCTGKVTATHKLSKKKRVSWSGRYTGDSAICTARIKGKLPVKNYGKKVKFSIKFPGNDSIKKFSASKSLTLSPPPPPPPPPPTPPTGPPVGVVFGPQSPGPWTVVDVLDASSGFQFTLGLDRKVPGLSSADGIGMDCAGLGTNTHVPTHWNNQNFSMGSTVGTVGSDGAGFQVPSMSYSITWNFGNAHSGSGHFSAVGSYQPANPGPSYTCTTSFDVVYNGGNP